MPRLAFAFAESCVSSQHVELLYLQGKKVFITASVKPSKEMLISLVEAVHGQVHMEINLYRCK